MQCTVHHLIYFTSNIKTQSWPYVQRPLNNFAAIVLQRQTLPPYRHRIDPRRSNEAAILAPQAATVATAKTAATRATKASTKTKEKSRTNLPENSNLLHIIFLDCGYCCWWWSRRWPWVAVATFWSSGVIASDNAATAVPTATASHGGRPPSASPTSKPCPLSVGCCYRCCCGRQGWTTPQFIGKGHEQEAQGPSCFGRSIRRCTQNHRIFDFLFYLSA